MNKNVKKKRKGFTLIELIIVLAIMAIIAAIAIPNFNAVRNNSRVKADTQSCETVKRAVMMLAADGTVKGDTSKSASFTSGSITATGTGGYTGITFTDGSTAAWTSGEKSAFVEAIKEVKAAQSTTSNYLVTIDGNGSVTVSLGSSITVN